MISLGHAGLLAIGAYASALLAITISAADCRNGRGGRRDHGAARHADHLSLGSACAGIT